MLISDTINKFGNYLNINVKHNYKIDINTVSLY